MSEQIKPCPECGAPCNTYVRMRGGDYGWGTTDEERTKYAYTKAEPDPLLAILWNALRDAMDWNWLDEDARPSPVADRCDAALSAYRERMKG